jgi:hypothetical protein
VSESGAVKLSVKEISGEWPEIFGPASYFFQGERDLR